MGITQFIQEHGYLAVALGSFLEGEAVLLAGSLAAYHGHLELALVLPLAAIASFLGDLPYFFLGRRYGEALLERYPALRARKARVDILLQRHHGPFVLSLRFLYGLRIAGLIALGMSRMSAPRFLFLDGIGALIWASLVCATGYGLGRVVQELFGNLGSSELVSMVLVLFVSGSLLITFMRRRKMASIRMD